MRTLKADEGAMAVVVALLAVTMFGFGALVVDMGALYAERRELQNGSDAAVLSIAGQCADSGCPSSETAYAAVGVLADENARDDRAGLAVVCSNDSTLLAGDDITNCAYDEDNSDLQDALDAYDANGVKYIAVTTMTERGDGTTSMPPMLRGLIDDDGKRVGATSVAAWGGPAGSVENALPLTVSYCEWAHMTEDGADMPDWPLTTADLLTTDIAESERKIVFFGGSSEDPELNNCRDLSAGTELPEEPNPDTPGGFGWVDGAKDDCEATTIVDGTYEAESGNADGDCATELRGIHAETWGGEPRLLYLPVYESVASQTYTLQTYVGFVLTGFRLGSGCGPASKCERASAVSNSTHPAGEMCNARNWRTGDLNGTTDANNQNCITGFFVRAPAPDDATVGGPSLGVTVYDLVH